MAKVRWRARKLKNGLTSFRVEIIEDRKTIAYLGSFRSEWSGIPSIQKMFWTKADVVLTRLALSQDDEYVIRRDVEEKIPRPDFMPRPQLKTTFDSLYELIHGTRKME